MNKYDNTKVKELINDNYKINKKNVKIKKQDKNPGLIIFYSIYCGYCNMAAPEIIKLADKKKINVYAINCLEEKNKELCDFFKISGVPHIRFVKETGLISKEFDGYNRILKDFELFIKKNKNKKIKK